MDSFPDQGADDLLGFFSQILKPKEAWRWSEEAYRHHYRCQMLIKRPSAFNEMWAQDESVQRVLHEIFKALDKWHDWPNHNFIPDDPLSVVFFNYWNDLEGAAAMNEVEDALKIKHLAEKESLPWQSGTLGEYVDALCRLIHHDNR